MPYLETPEELAEWLADKVGVYGGCNEDEEDHHCTNETPCRICWTVGVAARIRESVVNEMRLAKKRAAHD